MQNRRLNRCEFLSPVNYHCPVLGATARIELDPRNIPDRRPCPNIRHEDIGCAQRIGASDCRCAHGRWWYSCDDGSGDVTRWWCRVDAGRQQLRVDHRRRDRDAVPGARAGRLQELHDVDIDEDDETTSRQWTLVDPGQPGHVDHWVLHRSV